MHLPILPGAVKRAALPMIGGVALAASTLGPSALPVHASCTYPCAYDTYVTSNLSSGLAAYYSMTETSGTTMNDTSGNGLNGSFDSGTTLDGVDGYEFDGSHIASSPAINLSGDNDVTLNAEVLDEETATTTRIMWENSTNYNSFAGAFLFDLFDNSSTYPWTLSQDQAVGPNHSPDNYNITDFARTVDHNNYHMYTWILRRDTSGLGCADNILYIDGVSQTQHSGSECHEMSGVAFPDKEFYFGGRSGEHFDMKVRLRGMAIWGLELTSTQISDLASQAFQ